MQHVEPNGSLATALAHGEKLLAARPALAEEQAREILKVVPGHIPATLLLADALQAQGKVDAAVDVLEILARANSSHAGVYYALARGCSASGDSANAITALRRVTALEPRHPAAWRALGDQLTLSGETEAANNAYARHIQASVNDARLLEAANALCDGRLAVAEQLLRAFLKTHPTDVAAIRMLAETGSRLGRYEDAENLLARCLELAPDFTMARQNYATVLHRQMRSEEALRQIAILLEGEPQNPNYHAMRGAALVRIGEYREASACYEKLLAHNPSQPKAWMSYGHALKTVGRLDESIAAYRKAIALLPSLGEAYWSLANLKTFRFTADDIAAMRVQLGRSDLGEEDRYHLDFSLGKALEDDGDYATSFKHYQLANALRRNSTVYNADETTEHVRRSQSLFTHAFFAARAGTGCKAADPIFVVGLPRAGSTLIEQILSSHSEVEGTMELPDLVAIARRLGGKKKRDLSAYLDGLDRRELAEYGALGEDYLARARVQRKSDKPHFIDKMPNNFQHIGLIHLILPNAKIIDARRHPLGCCFSNFKQHFARGQGFAYDLNDLGRYYSEYVALMAHYDALLPGRIHRVLYERMVAHPEEEIRALLAYCGLTFEGSCLRFYDNDRAVRTASSEQVRQPIYTSGVDQWRHFEPWLGPLEAALGPLIDSYPVPSANIARGVLRTNDTGALTSI